VVNDITEYNAGRQSTINSAFGTLLVLIGLPIYFFYRARNQRRPTRET
jgi:hypothetical protein